MLKIFIFTLMYLSLAKSYAQWTITPSPANINSSVEQFRYSPRTPDYIWWRDYNAGISNDGGISFSKFNLPVNFRCYDIIPLNKDSAFLLLSPTGVSGPIRFKLYKTFNRGLDFIPDTFINDTSLMRNGPKMVVFFDNLNGSIIGDSVGSDCINVFTTQNGGNSWTKTPCNEVGINAVDGFLLWSYFGKVVFGDRAIIKSPTSLKTVFYKTWDKGRTWKQYEAPFKTSRLFAFKDSLNGITQMAYSNNGKAAITIDGGKTWDTTIVILPGYQSDMTYANNNTNTNGVYIIGGNQGAYYSIDDGKNWILIDDIDVKHQAIAFYDTKTGISSYTKTDVSNGIRIYNGTSLKLFEVEYPQKLSIWPNPCSDKLFIDGSFTEIEYFVFDITGKMILNGVLSKGLDKVELITAHLNNGFYIISIKNLEHRSNTAFYKQ